MPAGADEVKMHSKAHYLFKRLSALEDERLPSTVSTTAFYRQLISPPRR
jgi:hypothetical protein